MMSDSDHLLELIEDGVVAHGGDLGGWTRRADDTLQLFDGRVTLRAELRDTGPATGDGAVHAHVLTTLHEYEDEVLDACLFGMGTDRKTAVAQASVIWITAVAGPIKSFLDNKPICMTCQAGVAGGDVSKGYAQGDYGLAGLRAYVGPSITRGFNNENVQLVMDDMKPWFRFAAQSAAPRRVHLAKASIFPDGKNGWRRELEIDGHEVSHVDPDWPAARTTDLGYLIRFAVFEFPGNSIEISRRAELERTIRHFAQNYPSCGSVDLLTKAMVNQGFDADLVHEVESISTIAFGRIFFEHHGIQYSSTVIRARRDGRVEVDVPLMSIPAYSRARAIAAQLLETMTKDDFMSLCMHSAESHGILQALEAGGEKMDLTQMTLFPCVVPERNVSDQTMDQALATLHNMAERKRSAKKRPWWKFW